MTKPLVVYCSITGNTKRIAEEIERAGGGEALQLNVAKKDRKKRSELREEAALMQAALEKADASDIVFIGTPAEFRRPHPQVMEFIGALDAKRAAVFCTYNGMLGAMLIDMEARLQQRGIRFAGKLDVRVGTKEYKFRKNVDQYNENLTEAHLSSAAEFAKSCLAEDSLIKPRLRGICGRDCRECGAYKENKYKGAAARCWSGREC